MRYKWKVLIISSIDILKQTKLTKEEWVSIEKPVSTEELRILKMINDGYNNVNHRVNYTLTMFGFTKLERTQGIEHFLYDKYFVPLIKKMIDKYGKISLKLSAFSTNTGVRK